MNLGALPFREVWAVDFEFSAPDGERPTPLCMVAKELRTGRLICLWREELAALHTPPFAIDADVLFIAYYASAELGCFMALGWPMPARVLDLCAEFKCLTSGRQVECGRGLLGALLYYGLGGLETAAKESMRQLAMRGGAYTDTERAALIDYCQSDVDALEKLLAAMLAGKTIDLPRALLRGRYMIAAARIEWAGVPIDTEMLLKLRQGWLSIQDRLIAAVDADYGVYDGRVFKAERWAAWLERRGIPWPRLESGALDLSRDAFHEMARAYPAVAPMGELRHALSELRLNDLAVGSDGRNRCLLGAFSSKTGRNQPSNSKFIFGPSVWLRSLIRPQSGHAVAYLDWEQQEFGIAGALSGDRAMMDAYRTGDPYLTFAKQAGAVPADATKQTHKTERERFKVCALAVQYGMGERSLALKLNASPAHARELLRLHRQTYPRYWEWSDSVEARAMLCGELSAAFGWKVHVGADANPRSLRNFPLQANGAEMLRIACCLMTEAGITVCAPVHDAVLIEADADHIDEAVEQCQRFMETASKLVLDGFALRTEAKVIRHPERYSDPRGSRMWQTVNRLLSEIPTPSTGATLPLAPVLPPSSLMSSIRGVTPDGAPGNRSGTAPATPRTEGTDAGEDPTSAPPAAGEVPARTDPVDVAGACGTAEGAGAAGGVDPLEGSGVREPAAGDVLPALGDALGDEPRYGAAGAAAIGVGEPDHHNPPTRSRAGGDDLECGLRTGSSPSQLLDLPRHAAAVAICQARHQGDRASGVAMRDAWRERMAICTIDGGLAKDHAEAVALTVVLCLFKEAQSTPSTTPLEPSPDHANCGEVLP